MELPDVKGTKEAIKLAKKMGVKLDGYEAEAEEIWRKLDDMASNNPLEYQSFLQQQYKTAEEPEESSSASRCFRPKAGFSVETSTVDGDGIKIREVGKSSGKQFFVNVCSHEAVDLPIDEFNRPVSILSSNANGLQIPLAIGEVRSDKVCAVDVVVHPSVVKACQSSDAFKNQVIELAIVSVTNEKGIKMSAERKETGRSYNGGIGEDKSTPTLFFVNNTENNNSSNNGFGNNNKAASVLASPSDLLKGINNDRTATSTETVFPLRSNNDNIKVSNNNVIPGNNVNEKNGNKTSSGPAIKKGFLNQSKASLYPNGSSEGSGSDKGGSFARVMDKCQVINMNDPNPYGASSSSSSSTPLVPATTTAPTKNNSAPTKNKNPTAEVKKNLPTNQESADMERLMSMVDSEFKNIQQNSNHSDEQFSNILADMAKLLAQNTSQFPENTRSDFQKEQQQQQQQQLMEELFAPPPPPQPPVASKTAAIALNSSTDNKKPLFEITSNRSTNGKIAEASIVDLDSGDTKKGLVVRLSGFDGAFVMSNADIQVNQNVIKVLLSDEQISVKLLQQQHTFNAASCSASYSKKKGLLTLKIDIIC